MDEAAISPSTAGATTYRISASRRFQADLRLDVRTTAPFPSISVRYPGAAAGMRATLGKGDDRLELLPGPIDDGGPGDPDPTFAGRRVIAQVAEDGASRVLHVEIRIGSGGVPGVDDWSLRVSAFEPTDFELSQAENDPAAPTIVRLMCDPVARFEIGGELLSPGVTSEQASVHLDAEPGATAANVVLAAGAPAPPVRYSWKASGAGSLPDLPACEADRSVRFFAPRTSPEVGSDDFRSVTIELLVWFDGACPDEIGFLESSTSRELEVRELGDAIVIGPEVEVAPSDARDYFAVGATDGADGIVVAWASDAPEAVGLNVFIARLDRHQFPPQFSVAEALTPELYRSQPSLAPLPNGKWILAYRRDNPSPGTGQKREHYFRHAPFDQLASAPEFPVAPGSAATFEGPNVVVSGEFVLFLFNLDDDPDRLYYRRYRHATSEWIDRAPQLLAASILGKIHVATTDSGQVWVAFADWTAGVVDRLHAFRLAPTTGSIDSNLTIPFSGSPSQVVLLVEPAGDAMLIWLVDHVVRYRPFRSGSWQSEQGIPGLDPDEFVRAAASDAYERRWLATARLNGSIARSRLVRSWTGDAWSQPLPLSENGNFAELLITPESTLWAIGTRRADSSSDDNPAWDLIALRIRAS